MSIIYKDNLVQNGSFELFDAAKASNYGDWSGTHALESWTLTGVQKDRTNWFEIVQSGHRGVVTEYGSRWLDMDASAGNIGISQQISGVEQGKKYTLFLTASASKAGNGIDVFWGGEKIASILPDGIGMKSYSFIVTGSADPTANTLRIVGTGAVDGHGVSLDDVALVRNPDPVVVDPDAPFVIDAIHHLKPEAEAFKFAEGSGRQFFVDFDAAKDRIHIGADIATNFVTLQSKAAIYQSEGSTAIEFHNGKDLIVLTQFDLSKLTQDMFVFDTTAVAKTVGQNLVVNGSFESFTTTDKKMSWGVGAIAIEGWTLEGAARNGSNWFELHKEGVRGVEAVGGDYWLDSDASPGNIAFSQAISGVEAGRTHTLTVHAAASKVGNSVDVFWGASKIGSIAPDSAKMKAYTYDVVGGASAAENVLRFVGNGKADGYGVSLDDVSLFAHEVVEAKGDVHEFGLASGRVYVHQFDGALDKVKIRADLAANIDELLSQISVYQDDRATIVEFKNGREVLVFTNFEKAMLTEAAFIFEADASPRPDTREVIMGTASNDTLIGGAGSQQFDGGAGFDVLTGGVDADLFVFSSNSGRDFIVDFMGGEDTLLLSRDFASDYDSLLQVASIYQDGRSTQIEFGTGQMITLYGVDAATVKSDWFQFA